MRRRILTAIDRACEMLRRLCGCEECNGTGWVTGLSCDSISLDIPCPWCRPEAAGARDFVCLAAHEEQRR